MPGDALTTDQLHAAQSLQGQRVRIAFTDGQQVLARLISLSPDLDGTYHLLYDDIEWAALPHNDIGSGAFYAGGHEIVCLVAAGA